ncbi:MAG: NAD(P)H-dependent oxidoreductase [Verrucomicrobiales bacterium]
MKRTLDRDATRELLLEQLNWRYATKQFDPGKTISQEDWNALEQAILLTPSAYGLQPWEIIVVTDPEARAKLLPVSYGQRQVVDASHLVVFAIKKDFGLDDLDKFIDRIAEVRNVSVESLSGLRSMILNSVVEGMDEQTRNEWAARQVYIALGNFLTSAAILGVDVCPMEGFDPVSYNKILNLEEKGLSAVVIATAGYRLPVDSYSKLAKVRLPKSAVIHEIAANKEEALLV